MADTSTDDTVTPVDMDDLDAFEAKFYGSHEPVETPEKEEVDETESDQLATEEDTDADSDQGKETAEEDESSEAEDPVKDEAPAKKNRKSAKERIEELVADVRVTERERDALRRELEELRAQVSKPEVKDKEPEKASKLELPAEAPKPDALDDKGEPVYPLGEFDPLFIRDLTKFTIEQETKAAEAERVKQEQARELQEAQEALNKSWNEKVEKVVEDLPDYHQKVRELGAAFQGIDQQYGDYLATTIMQCDNGPEIMYYLSQNIGEAQTIVASGPVAATLAIGRLQSKLDKPAKEETSNTKKVTVSDAPTPPATQLRGKSGQFAVRPDTDDLDAFEKEFYK